MIRGKREVNSNTINIWDCRRYCPLSTVQQERRRQFCVWQANSPNVRWSLLDVMPQASFLFVFHLFHVTHNKHPSSLSGSDLLRAFPCISKLMGRSNGKKYFCSQETVLSLFFKYVSFPKSWKKLPPLSERLGFSVAPFNLTISPAHSRGNGFDETLQQLQACLHLIWSLGLFTFYAIYLLIYCRIDSLWTDSSGLSTGCLLQGAERSL